MKRVLIFTGLSPPLVMLVYVVATGLVREGMPEGGFLAWLIGAAYVVGFIPAFLAAGADGALSSKPGFTRLLATMSLAAIMIQSFARYMGQPSFEWQVPAAGAIPAAICTLLSSVGHRGAT